MPAFPGVGDTFAGYRILRVVGPVTLGRVFEARQVEPERLVVLTLPSPEDVDDASLRERFLREAEALKALDSPHVARVLDFGQDDGLPFAATELTGAPDLAMLLHQFGPLPAPTALTVGAQLASALVDLHGAGVVHRDIRPGNVAIADPRTNPVALLGGFGLAVQATSISALQDSDAVALEYMAPEQRKGADATVASDIYSLGCVLSAALTGGGSYQNSSAGHEQLDDLLKRALDRRRSRRFSSAAAMHARILDVRASSQQMTEDGVGMLLTKTKRSTVTLPAQRRDAPERPPEAAAHTPDAPPALALETPAPAPESPADPPGTTPQVPREPRRRPRTGTVLLALLLVGLLAGCVGIAAALLGGGDPEPSDSGVANQPTGQKSRAPATDEDEITCPNGGEVASSLSECPMPAGSAEMRLVFPSLDQACTPAVPNPRTDEVRAFNCDSGTSVVRYSRWEEDGDRYGYLDGTYPQAKRSDWFIEGKPAGQTWSAHAEDIDPDLPDVWAATYRQAPFTVIVKAADDASRDAARKQVEAAEPSVVRQR